VTTSNPTADGHAATAGPGRAAADAQPVAVTATGVTIDVSHVSRWYGNVVAVNDVSISIGAGVTGLLGPNGAGKSTLLHLAAGLLRPSVGTVTVLGASAWRNPDVYRRVGLVPERENVHAFLTGREFIELNARLQDLPDPAAAARRAIRIVELDDAADRAVGTYSKGMRQRIKVAAALVHEPEVLLLDEPFNGMDPRQRLHMMELLTVMAAEGRTVLFSSHILEEVERLAQNVLVIVAGRLAASGNFREIRRLMTDRPHTFTIRSSDDRNLAAVLMTDAPVFGVELADGLLTVRSEDYAAFTRVLAGIARRTGVRLYEVRPTDESLESVFAYLVQR
jgi:ABC-2 type transport system ATP-binding protein